MIYAKKKETNKRRYRWMLLAIYRRKEIVILRIHKPFSVPNFRRHLSSVFSFLFFLTNYRLGRNLYVKLKDWMSNSIGPDETAHNDPSHLDLCCLQKPIIIACGSDREAYPGIYVHIGTTTTENAQSDMYHKRSLIRIFIRAVWSESTLATFWNSQECKVSSCGQRKLCSDCANAQADLSCFWVHMSEGTFPHIAAHLIQCPFLISALLYLHDFPLILQL